MKIVVCILFCTIFSFINVIAMQNSAIQTELSEVSQYKYKLEAVKSSSDPNIITLTFGTTETLIEAHEINTSDLEIDHFVNAASAGLLNKLEVSKNSDGKIVFKITDEIIHSFDAKQLALNFEGYNLILKGSFPELKIKANQVSSEKKTNSEPVVISASVIHISGSKSSFQ